MKKIFFRIDDFGASAKYYEQHGKKIFRVNNIPVFYFPLSDFWFFKRIWPFREWAKYEELSATELLKFIKIFQQAKIIPIFSLTATWVDLAGNLIPYNEKFSLSAEVLKKFYQSGDIQIANHGLTHCVVEQHRPRFFSSNRQFYREFWPYLPAKLHEEHILRSQDILENFLERPVTIFVPPGNVWSIKTAESLLKTNIKTVMAKKYLLDSDKIFPNIVFHQDDQDFRYHDRDLKLKGEKWLQQKVVEFNSFVYD